MGRKVMETVERIMPKLIGAHSSAELREVTEQFLRDESSLPCPRCHYQPLRVFVDSLRWCPNCQGMEGELIPDDGFDPAGFTDSAD